MKLSAIKGMQDVLPAQIAAWQYLEQEIRKLCANYGYSEIRTPIVERTQLFKRSIGEVTDIVEKEMFSFPDQNEESLSLRPEGTAGCVRACIEHALLRNNQVQKLWYMGPMFRYERPQKGRYRQFYQVGVEAFNIDDPTVDVEQIAMVARLWKNLGLSDIVELQINSLGDSLSRETFREKLVDYFNTNFDKLDEDSKRRLKSNPLRILDSKNPDLQQLIADAPKILDFIDEKSKNDFTKIQSLLTALKIKFTINPRIVRGLDYYNGIVYEWVSDKLGSQSAVCAGGRYDTLVEQLDGPASPAVGFAFGVERINLLLEELGRSYPNKIDGYLICLGDKAYNQVNTIAEKFRDSLPSFNLLCNMSHASLKNLLQKADKLGASYALIIGEDEIENQTVTIKNLRDANKNQTTVKISEIAQILGDV